MKTFDSPLSRKYCHLKLAWPTLILLTATLTACGGGGSSGKDLSQLDDRSTSARATVLPAGDTDCPQGGILVETGIDENGNGQLDDSEVDSSEKLCNGQNGLSALIDFEDEPAGANCPYGGMRIKTGLDSNGNGVLDDSEISENRYVCSLVDSNMGWQVPSPVETSISALNFTPMATADSKGNMQVVWLHRDNQNLDEISFQSRRLMAGSGWSSVETLETLTDPGTMEGLAFAGNSTGTNMLVWSISNGSHRSIFARLYHPVSGWADSKLIETDDQQSAEKPQVAVDASNRAMVIWEQYQGIGDQRSIWYNRYLPGSEWGTAQELASPVDQGQSRNPRLAMDNDGNAMAIWNQWDGSKLDLWFREYRANDGWQTAALVEHRDENIIPLKTSLAMNSGGIAVASWMHSNGPQTQDSIWVNIYRAGSGWENETQIGSAAALNIDSPYSAVDHAGNAFVVWTQDDGYGHRVWFSRYEPASGWSNAEKLPGQSYADASDAKVYFDDDGNAMAVWTLSDGASRRIWASRFLPGQGWSTPSLASLEYPSFADQAKLVFDPDGNAAVFFMQWGNGTGELESNIYYNRWVAP